ncbi:30S ribosomal protein S16 [bacterium]|nr:30S ribosomal protein S16 [bacterium]
MLVIRMLRIGKKNQPSFKIVVIDKRKPPKSGNFVEEVGFWNPITKEKVLREERIKYWISKGVQLSASVHNLLVSEKILEGKKIPKHKKPKSKKEEKPKEEEISQKEDRSEEEKKEEKPVSKEEESKREAGEVKEEKPEDKKEVQTLDKSLKKE